MDSFYRPLTAEEKIALESEQGFNFDVPSAFDYPLIMRTLQDLLKGEAVKIPVYDFVTSDRVGWEEVSSADVIIFEGILALYWEKIRSLMDVKLFVDTPSDTRLARRILRDTRDRGRHLEQVLLQYERFVKPAFESYIYPTKEHADIILPRGSGNIVGVNVIVGHIQGKLGRPRVEIPSTIIVPNNDEGSDIISSIMEEKSRKKEEKKAKKKERKRRAKERKNTTKY